MLIIIRGARREENIIAANHSVFKEHLLSSKWLLGIVFFTALCVRLFFLNIAPNNTTDAWARYHGAVLWIQNPSHLPKATSSDAWLPLHFWLLGAVLWVAKSETAARVFTALLGSLTLLFYSGIVTRAFDRRAAQASTLLLALFGFHIAFSVTTGSEVPTIFFMAIGVYGWLLFASEGSWGWAWLSAMAFGAASLCRFEPWLCPPVLSLLLLDVRDGRSPAWSERPAWSRALGFGLLASAGAVGWLIFSYLKWGDPLELPHRTMWLNLHFRAAALHHSLYFKLAAVPGALLISLSPLVFCLACLGLLRMLARGAWAPRSLGLLALTLPAFNYWNSVRYEITQARYTLLYSWLLIPFAFEGLRWISTRWRWAGTQAALTAVIGFFLLWQTGIVLGAEYAPPSVADRLGEMSPALPLHHEMRELTNWLIENTSGREAVILDDINWESVGVLRFSHLNPAQVFQVGPQHYANPSVLKEQLEDFVRRRRPGLLVCSPYGPIGVLWLVDHQQTLQVKHLGLQLNLSWQGKHWQTYTITYE